MDELRAYKVLGLEPGASREEIKEAYARLSKEFHPEECPEEFQQIHEAYRLLGRASRGGRRAGNREEEVEEVQQERQPEPQQIPEGVKIAFEEERIPQDANKPAGNYDFEEALHKAQQTEQQRLHEEVLRAEAEFRILIQPEYRNKTKMFSAFFKKEEHKQALASREFVGKLAVLIEESNLKKKVYREIVSYYRLQDKEPEKLVPEGQALYQALSQKVDIKAGLSAAQSAAPIGIMAGLWAGIRPFARMFDQVGMIVLLIAFIACGVWIYVACHKKRSHIFAQMIILVYINLVLFIGYVGDIWTSLVGGEELMLSIVSNCLLISVGWMIALIFYSAVKIIKNRKK